MAERVQPPAYWVYDEDDGEEGVIVSEPTRSTRDGPTGDWNYPYKPKVGERVLVVVNRDSDLELTIEVIDNPDVGQFYIYDQCVRPAVVPVPEDVDLTKPEDIEKWLEDA